MSEDKNDVSVSALASFAAALELNRGGDLTRSVVQNLQVVPRFSPSAWPRRRGVYVPKIYGPIK